MKQKKKGLGIQLTFMLTIIVVAVVAVVATILIIVPRASSLIEKNIHSHMLYTVKAECNTLNIEKADANRDGKKMDYDFYADILGNVKLDGLENSYAYLVSSDGTMLYHPTQSKVGQPVENAVVKDLVQKLQEGNVPEADIVSYDFEGSTKYAAYDITKAFKSTDGSGDYQILVFSADKSDAMAEINSLTLQAIIASVIILAVLIGFGVFISTKISKPLLRLAEVTNSLSDGYINTDCTIKSNIRETNQIISSVQKLQETLKMIAENIKTATGALTDSVDGTNALCISSSDGANHISSTVEELSHTAMSMADSVQLLNTEMIDIGDNINGILTALDNLNNSSANMNNISAKAKNDIHDVYLSSEESVNAVGIITEHISELSDAINEVTEATTIISGISSQTSLLALNASIEAARAGEAGRGFAVVATEISNLASQSDDSTKQIDDVINKVLELSKKSVSMAESIKDTIAEEQAKVKQTQESFLELKTQIDNSVEQIAQISAETDKLTHSKDKALSSVSDLSAISEENAASNEAVTSSVTDLSEHISDIANRTGDMTSMAETLTDAISAFKES